MNLCGSNAANQYAMRQITVEKSQTFFHCNSNLKLLSLDFYFLLDFQRAPFYLVCLTLSLIESIAMTEMSL
jgi:hypothetical protein